MTSCNLNNWCWFGDGKEICPCQPVIPLVLIILGVILVLVVLTLLVQYANVKHGKNFYPKGEFNKHLNENHNSFCDFPKLVNQPTTTPSPTCLNANIKSNLNGGLPAGYNSTEARLNR